MYPGSGSGSGSASVKNVDPDPPLTKIVDPDPPKVMRILTPGLNKTIDSNILFINKKIILIKLFAKFKNS